MNEYEWGIWWEGYQAPTSVEMYGDKGQRRALMFLRTLSRVSVRRGVLVRRMLGSAQWEIVLGTTWGTTPVT